jgi:hypothetical protein
MKTRRLVLSVSLLLLTLASFPALGRATFIPGPPGKIAFVSGRPADGVPAPNAGDAGSRIFVVDYPGGSPVQVTTQPEGATVRHRQPNWSPDHTRIVYAAGSTKYALWILDLRTGSQTEFVPPATGLDRPSWSPDGSEIAYESEGDLWVKEVSSGATPERITETPAFEERPVWSPDGNTLYYNAGPEEEAKQDLYSISPVAPGATQTPILTGGENDWQPALSPDGKRLCFLRGPKGAGADLWLVSVNGGLPTPFATSGLAELNCVWSPDGSKIMYTQGDFGLGELGTQPSNAKGFDAFAFNVKEHFDGNADWATNFSPECADRSASIDVNKFATVSLSCTDPDFGFGKSPPTPRPLESTDLEILTQPAHGTLGGISDEGNVIYTPVKDFHGTDTFTYTGSDSVSNADPATVTITVGQNGGGGKDRVAPRISKIKVSPRRWRRGERPARISRAPVGTTISFRLSERARTTLSFQRKRRKRGRTRFAGVGKLSFAGRAGRNRVRFQGLLKKSKKLPPGSYRVVISARDTAGNRAKRTGPTFTIVPG